MSAFSYDGSMSVLARGPFASVDEVAEVARNHVAVAIDDADDAIMRCEREIEAQSVKRERIAQHRDQLTAWLSAEGYAIETHEDGTKTLVKVE